MSPYILGWHIMKERLSAGRMLVIWPLLAMFIMFSSWGLSDPKANLPANLVIDSAYDVMFASTAFIIFSATMGAVLISFDGVSRDRLTGVLEIKLSQPINRSVFARALLIGHWGAIFLPVLILNIFSLLIIWYRLEDLPSIEELFIHTLGTALLLLWYTSMQLLASSWAKDIGSSIAVGLGVWMLFTLLWLVLTTVVAGLSGVGVENLNSPEFTRIEAIMDLFSPNGVYHHLLEMPLEDVNRSSPLYTSIAAILWSIIPLKLFIRRIERIYP
ncbi:MAG: ABC transporter permease [Candidatus Poseidoniaceae archaeon]|nr:ABC transporter permease [Candidatus Poseidoniaceae archaeon]